MIRGHTPIKERREGKNKGRRKGRKKGKREGKKESTKTGLPSLRDTYHFTYLFVTGQMTVEPQVLDVLLVFIVGRAYFGGAFPFASKHGFAQRLGDAETGSGGLNHVGAVYQSSQRVVEALHLAVEDKAGRFVEGAAAVRCADGWEKDDGGGEGYLKGVLRGFTSGKEKGKNSQKNKIPHKIALGGE
jgi:hypothetical protein